MKSKYYQKQIALFQIRLRSQQTQCLLWNVNTDPKWVEMKKHWPLTLQQNILKLVPDRCPDLSLRMQLQKFVFPIVLAWEYWLAKMLSLEKMGPMCTTIYLKRHVNFYCVYDHESEANYGQLFCVYDSLCHWKIELSTKFIAARQLNNNQPSKLVAWTGKRNEG